MTSLIWRYSFMTTSIFEDATISPNYHNITAEMSPNVDSYYEHEVAMQRMEYFLEHVVNNSVIMTDAAVFNFLSLRCTNSLMMFPEEPYDQMMAVILHCKLTAIMEDRMTITKLTASSTQGNEVEYIFDPDYEYPEFFLEEIDDFGTLAWWARPDLMTFDSFEQRDDGKKKLRTDFLSWETIGLGWDEPPDDDEEEKQEPEVVNIKKFRPKVIEGGKK